MNDRLLEYYAGDELAASVWQGKYAGPSIFSSGGGPKEQTPYEMHERLTMPLCQIETNYSTLVYNSHIDISPMGVAFWNKTKRPERPATKGKVEETRMVDEVMSYLHRYKYIIPQGSIMAMLGNRHAIGSLSNCFVIPSPVDSYGGIFKTDQQVAQLEKRRGGVGLNLNTLRPEGTGVLNAAGSSTGAHSFMDRYSSTTREVAQNGRRGALMLLMDCRHPDIFKFVRKKADLTKVTGANVSVMLTDEFMKAVQEDGDFYCKFPLSSGIHPDNSQFIFNTPLGYNEMMSFTGNQTIMRIKAKELYDEIVNMAWSNGEPGVAFIDRVHEYSPEGVYEQYRAVASNPCGEQWMQAYDACRLLALNLYNIVINPFTKNASIDYDKLYEIAYVQQRLADDVVDLEIEAVEKIINKIKSDPEPEDVKATELALWENIKRVAKSSRRTGCGFTALADMLAALGLKYDSQEALEVIEKVMKTKMRGELDSTIDMAIVRGPFEGWDKDKEFELSPKDGSILRGKNEFFHMLGVEFPEQAARMCKYGRRNLNWSTVAPTGTVSIVTLLNKYPNTSAGVEPQFACYYMRNRKINPSDKDLRVDFTDANGDSWMTYPVVMGGLREWIDINERKATMVGVNNLPKEVIEELFKKSPYYGSCANDISWKRRIEIQSIVQRYTTNAISSTLNLPNDVSKEVVSGIYHEAWKNGLKGVTVYRDGCRTGVLTNEPKKIGFEYKDAVKRPKEIDADLHVVSVKGIKYAVVIGLLEGNPYEVFAFNLPDEIKDSCKGKTVKVKRGHYNFICDDTTIKDLQIEAARSDEQVLTRLISGMLRHGTKPQFVMEQIDKCDLEIISFGKAISRTLKKYCVEDELISRSTCSNCGSTNLRMQEGCLTCMECSNSKCG